MEPISSKPVWVHLLKTTFVRDIVDPNQKIVSVSYNQYVYELLNKLAESKVLAAVVTTPEKPGILEFVLEATSTESLPFELESVKNMQWHGKSFSLESSGNLISTKNTIVMHLICFDISKRDDMKTVQLNTPLSKVMEIFCSEIHRVGVVDQGKLVNVLSQTDILRFLATRGVYIGSKIERQIKDVGLEPLGVVSVLESVSTIDVVRFMKVQMISGVAVVDSNSRLVGNFSASDLLVTISEPIDSIFAKGLNESNFPALNLPVKDFLQRMQGFSKPPVSIKSTDTVELLLLKMVVHQVHRIYIVDDSMKAIGVVTNTDLMQFFVAE